MYPSFFEEMAKISSAGEIAEHALDVGGLGLLTLPALKDLTSKKKATEEERKRHAKYELGGLGVLAAHPTYTLAKKGINAFSHKLASAHKHHDDYSRNEKSVMALGALVTGSAALHHAKRGFEGRSPIPRAKLLLLGSPIALSSVLARRALKGKALLPEKYHLHKKKADR